MAEIPTPASGYSAQKNRPLGITILSILLILGGASNILGVQTNMLLYGPLYGIFYVGLGALNLIIGIALFQLIPWSRMAAIVMELVGLILSFVLIASIGGMMESIMPGSSALMFVAIIPSAVIALIVVGYLMQGSIKAAFESGEW